MDVLLSYSLCKGLQRAVSDIPGGNFQMGLEYGIVEAKAQGHLARKSLANKLFNLDSWSPGVGFFPIGTIN